MTPSSLVREGETSPSGTSTRPLWRRLIKPKTGLPGMLPSLSFTWLYLGVMVLLPMSALALATSSLTFAQVLAIVSAPRTAAALRLSFATAVGSGLVNVAAGTLVAWVLVRYRFPGRSLIDAVVDLPFALPTSVAGIALTFVYSEHGWLGRYAQMAGLPIAFTRVGIVVALCFVGMPFVVRTVQPVIQELDPQIEEAAQSLGATPLQSVYKVLLPALVPAIATGFALAFARAVGEYGSVLFIAGNMPMSTEIAPLLIVAKLEQFDYAGASVIGAAMLASSLTILLTVQLFERALERRLGGMP